MNKNYTACPLAIAVVTIIGTGIHTASAFELDVYGVGHLSADSNDDGQDSQGYIASNSSRLGVRGRHENSQGLHVDIQYESGVDLTGRGTNDGNGPGTSNNLFSTSRDAFVSLGGDFGTVSVGRLGVLNQWLYDYNLFADQIGDLGNIWGGTGIPGRINGIVSYTTPEFGESFKGFVGYVPESGTDNGDTTVLKLNMENPSGVKLGVGYSNQGNGNFGPALEDQTSFAITASYATGPFSVGGGYQSDADIAGINGDDRDSFTLGGSYSFGRTTLKAQFTNSTADTADGNTADGDAEMVAVGVDYALDKATTLYVAYAGTENDPTAAFKANNYGHGQAVDPAANGEDPSSFSVGIVYKFDANLIE